MSKRICIPIGEGVEEIELSTLYSTFERVGAFVTVASVNDLDVEGARGLRLGAECFIAECVDNTYDLIALPGGMKGAENLKNSRELEMMLKRQDREGRYIAAICAAPVVVLQHHGLLRDRRATCYPSLQSDLCAKEVVSDAAVVVDDNYITSQGPGTALAFALKLVELLYGDKAVRDVSIEMCATE